jgi:hypothetical protein
VLLTVDLPAGTVNRLPISPGYASKLVISPDGTRLWICNNFGRVQVLDLLTYANLAQPAVQSPWSVAFNRTGTRAYITSAPHERNGTLEVYNANTYTRIASIPVGFLPHGVSVSPSGRHVFVVNSWAGGSIMQISTATNTVVRTFPVGDFPSGLGMAH